VPSEAELRLPVKLSKLSKSTVLKHYKMYSLLNFLFDFVKLIMDLPRF